MQIGTVSQLAKSGSTVSVRLPSGKTVIAIAGNDITSTQVVVVESAPNQYRAFSRVGEEKRSSKQIRKSRRQEPTGIDYPFKNLSYWEDEAIIKGKDGSKKILGQGNFTPAGITNKGGRNYYACYLDYGQPTLTVHHNRNGVEESVSIDSRFDYSYYNGDFFGVVFDWVADYPTTTIETETDQIDDFNYSRTRTETGTGWERTYTISCTSGGSFTIPSVTIIVPEGESTGFTWASFSPMGDNTTTISDDFTATYNYILKTGIAGEEVTFNAVRTESTARLLTESLSGSASWEQRIEYQFPGGIFSHSTGMESDGTITGSYSLSHAYDHSKSVDSGNFSVPITSGFNAIALVRESESFAEDESTSGIGSVENISNPLIAPEIGPINTKYGKIPFTRTITEARENTTFYPTEYIQGIGGIALYADYKFQSTYSRDATFSGYYGFESNGYTPYYTGTVPVTVHLSTGDVNYTLTPTLTQSPTMGARGLGQVTQQQDQSPQPNYSGWHYPYDLLGTDDSLEQEQFNGVQGYYFVNGETQTEIDLSDSFFFLITNANSLEIPESLGTITIPQGNIPQLFSLLGKNSRLTLRRRTSISINSEWTHSNSPSIGAFYASLHQSELASTLTTNITTSYSEPEPIWDSLPNSPIALVRTEGPVIALYEGIFNYTYTDQWLTQTIQGQIINLEQRRIINSISLDLQSRTEIKYFCMTGITNPLTGFIYSRNNCTNLLRYYAKTDRTKINFYKKNGIFMAIAQPITNLGQKEKRHYADIYKLVDGKFIRQKEGVGALSSLSHGGIATEFDSLSFYP